jgi:hypothetical protein
VERDVKGAAVIGLVLCQRRAMLKRVAVFVNLALEVKDVTDVWKTFLVFQMKAAELVTVTRMDPAFFNAIW